jgi:hypothetical protein
VPYFKNPISSHFFHPSAETHNQPCQYLGKQTLLLETTPVLLFVGIKRQEPAGVHNLENGGNQEAHVYPHPHVGKAKIEGEINEDKGGKSVQQIR